MEPSSKISLNRIQNATDFPLTANIRTLPTNKEEIEIVQPPLDDADQENIKKRNPMKLRDAKKLKTLTQATELTYNSSNEKDYVEDLFNERQPNLDMDHGNSKLMKCIYRHHALEMSFYQAVLGSNADISKEAIQAI